MDDDPLPPSLPWRIGSAAVIGLVGALTRSFMHGLNTQETHGLDGFLGLLDERVDPEKRQRGLVTGMQDLGPIQGSLGLTFFAQSQIISACTYVVQFA